MPTKNANSLYLIISIVKKMQVQHYQDILECLLLKKPLLCIDCETKIVDFINTKLAQLKQLKANRLERTLNLSY